MGKTPTARPHSSPWLHRGPHARHTLVPNMPGPETMMTALNGGEFMKPMKRFTRWWSWRQRSWSLGPADVIAGSEGGDAHPALAAPQLLAGSWQVTYDVPAFGGPFPLLLSLGSEGVVIETDAPGKFALAPDLLVILSNGHGAWEPIRGRGAFVYCDRKLIYQEDGLTPFGITRTQARGRLSADGTYLPGDARDRDLRSGGSGALLDAGHGCRQQRFELISPEKSMPLEPPTRPRGFYLCSFTIPSGPIGGQVVPPRW